MSRQEAGHENIRVLGKTGSAKNPSYYITIPIEIVREFGWKEGQKLKVKHKGHNDDHELKIKEVDD